MKHLLALTGYSTSGTIHKWFNYVANGVPLQALDTSYEFPLGLFRPVTGLLSPAGKYFALLATNANPYLSIYNFVTDAVVNLNNVRPGYTNPIQTTTYGMAFSHDDVYLAIQQTNFSGYLTVIDTVNWNLETVPAIGGIGYQPSFNYNSTYLAIPHSNSPYLTVLDTSNWSVVSGTPVGSAAYAAEWSPDGSLLAVTLAASPYLRVYNTSNWSVVSGTPVLSYNSKRIRFSPDGTMLGISQLDVDTLRIYNTSNWTLKHTLSGGLDFDFSADSVYVASGFDSSPYLRIYDTATGTSQTTGITMSLRPYGVSYSKTQIVKTVSGITRNSSNNPGSFIVRLINRTTGQCKASKSSGIDGTYEFNLIPVAGKFQRVVVSSTTTAPLLNDLIDRVTPL